MTMQNLTGCLIARWYDHHLHAKAKAEPHIKITVEVCGETHVFEGEIKQTRYESYRGMFMDFEAEAKK